MFSYVRKDGGLGQQTKLLRHREWWTVPSLLRKEWRTLSTSMRKCFIISQVYCYFKLVFKITLGWVSPVWAVWASPPPPCWSSSWSSSPAGAGARHSLWVQSRWSPCWASVPWGPHWQPVRALPTPQPHLKNGKGVGWRCSVHMVKNGRHLSLAIRGPSGGQQQ